MILGGIGGFGGRGGVLGGFGGSDSVSSGFAWQGIDGGIRGIQQGLCDGFYAVNTGLLTGFNGVQSQLAECCCQTQRAIDGVNYNMATQFCSLGNTIQNTTRDLIENQNAGVQRIMDFMVNSKIESLQSENQALRFAASQANQNAFITANQEAQTAELIRRLGRDNPVPAYVVPNPNCCYGNPMGVGYNFGGNSGGCGCGCG